MDILITEWILLFLDLFIYASYRYDLKCIKSINLIPGKTTPSLHASQ